MSLILSYEQAEAGRAACSYRLAYIEWFRTAPNVHCSDNWDGVVASIENAKHAIEDDLLDDLDDSDLLQLCIGLELLIIDATAGNDLIREGLTVPAGGKELHDIICHLRGDD